MKTVFFGTGSFGLPSLEILKNTPHDPVLLVTASDKPQGRNLLLRPSPVKEWGLQHQKNIFEYSRTREAELVELLKKDLPDLFVVISFGFILSEKLLQIPRQAALNVHSSLLPRWRGAAPVRWALMEGDAETGVTVMRVIPELDAGDILCQKKTMILEADDALSLDERLSRFGAEALLEGIGAIEKQKALFLRQDPSAVTYARKITKEDGHIQWNETTRSILNRMKAVAGWPRAYSFLRGKRVILLQTAAAKNPGKGKAGTVLGISPAGGIWVASKDGALEIGSLQLEGKKPLPSQEFLKGFPVGTGDVFE